MPHDVIVDRAVTLREDVSKLVDEMNAAAGRFGLPPSLPVLEEARKRMKENVYNVLVMGEAKRGKSTLVNALMGAEILPTDVDIATSQVFYVRHAPAPAYRLRFEDDSAKEISGDELANYGKEHRTTGYQNPAMPSLSQTIRWIEVEGPFPFIPENVRILDSPGLGSLYAEHGRVIQRFVPQAEAVVFVLSSESPVSEFELESIGEVLRYTRHVFFVQTQIDLFSEEDWQQRWRRNEEILNKRFGGQIGSPNEVIHVWPISGKQLLNVMQTSRTRMREQFYQDSRFAPMERAFRRFLFQLTGCARVAQVMELSNQFWQDGRRRLMERADNAQAAGQEQRAAQLREKRQRMEQFIAEWSANGARRLDLERRAREARADIRAQFIAFFDYPTGFLYRHYEKQIDTVHSVAEAQHLAVMIEKEAAEKGNLHWLRCARAYRFKLTELLAPIFGDPNTWDLSSFQPVPNIRTRLAVEREPLEVKDTPVARAKMAWGGAAMLLGLGGALAAALALPAIALGGAWGALAYGVWEMHKAGNKLTEQNARPQLKNYLRFVLETIRSQYITPRLNEPCLVDAYFRRVEEEVFRRISDMYEQRRVDISQNLRELDQASKDGEETLQRKLSDIEIARANWELFLPRIAAYRQEVQDLYDAPLPSPGESGEPLSPEELEAATARYRELLDRVMEDQTITPEEQEQLDELADRLNLPRRLTRQLQTA